MLLPIVRSAQRMSNTNWSNVSSSFAIRHAMHYQQLRQPNINIIDAQPTVDQYITTEFQLPCNRNKIGYFLI
jgi:hypothetical protein